MGLFLVETVVVLLRPQQHHLLPDVVSDFFHEHVDEVALKSIVDLLVLGLDITTRSPNSKEFEELIL